MFAPTHPHYLLRDSYLYRKAVRTVTFEALDVVKQNEEEKSVEKKQKKNCKRKQILSSFFTLNILWQTYHMFHFFSGTI